MSKIIYKSNKNIVYSCKYHVVWCPKYRRKVLINGVNLRLKELIKSIAKEAISSKGIDYMDTFGGGVLSGLEYDIFADV